MRITTAEDTNLNCFGQLMKVSYFYNDVPSGNFFWCKNELELVSISQKRFIGDIDCPNGGNVIIFAEDVNEDGIVSDGDTVVNIFTICK
jgi:hypothetical protein